MDVWGSDFESKSGCGAADETDIRRQERDIRRQKNISAFSILRLTPPELNRYSPEKSIQ